jgi:hypothetical protein
VCHDCHLVEDLGRTELAAVVDVGGHREPALGQLAEEVDLAGVLRPQLERLLLNLVGQRCLFGILYNNKSIKIVLKFILNLKFKLEFHLNTVF